MLALRKCAILALLGSVSAQIPPAVPFYTGFNSSFPLSPAQIEAAALANTTAASINTIVNFDRSSLANGGPSQDEFYQLPNLSSGAISALVPGSLLKVQELTDTAPFAIAPGSSLSRILYTTLTFNGSVVPASAYVLWPYQSRLYGNTNRSSSTGIKAEAILWTHGTSGFFADAAPSADRALFYGDIVPLSLVQSGYVVVAPDFAGLGVGKLWNGSEIPHQYFAMPAGAKDSLFAMKVALETFRSRLSGQFATVGHSQGGGVAWSAAELLASTADSKDPEEPFQTLHSGYVGTVALSPVTEILSGPGFTSILTAMNLQSVFPDFTLDIWLQPVTVARIQLLREIQGSAIVAQQLFLSAPSDTLLKDSWYNSTYHARAFGQLMNVGQKPFAGPLLVIQDTEDVFVSPSITSAIVKGRCTEDPGSRLEYVIADGVRHTSVIAATRSRWMSWLEDRFDGKLVESGCKYVNVSGWLGPGSTSNGYLQWAGAPEYMYQNPGAN